jgi:hypothetical protein
LREPLQDGCAKELSESWFFHLFIETLVDPGDLGDPALTLAMFKRQDLLVRPMKVIGDVRYLLIEPL